MLHLTLLPIAAALVGGDPPPPIKVPVAPKAPFAAPVALTANGAPFEGILYPSPVLHDLDGDGQRELLIGEIFGSITTSRREIDGALTAFTKGKKETSGTEPLKLNNW